MKNNIRKLRKENGLTQQELADKLMVAKRTILHWEKELSTPTINFVYDLAKVFGVDVYDVYPME